MSRLACLSVVLVAACSSTAGSATDAGTRTDASSHDGGGRDAAADSGRDASGDARRDSGPDARDSGRDVVQAPDGPVPTTALVRLANWSPDAPGLDFCTAPHGTSIWSGPILATAVGMGVLGELTVVDAGLAIDAGHKRDAAADAVASHDASHGDASHEDASHEDAGHDAARIADAGATLDASDAGEAAVDAGPPRGVLFPRISPYVTLAPGEYDVRVVTAGAADCTAPILPEIDDLASFGAGAVVTLAAVGDTTDQGSDPALAVSAFNDDVTVTPSRIALRFVNAVPSVIEVTLASGTVEKGTAMPYLTAAQFGGAGVDTDAGTLDSNDYLSYPPIKSQIWSLINANGGFTALTEVGGVSVAAGKLATVVGVGGESGPSLNDIGILVCLDTPPIVAGETAACALLQEGADPVCMGCL